MDPFEIIVDSVLGEPMQVFRHRHRSLRELLMTSQRFGPIEYLVFPESRITYGAHLEMVAAVATGLVQRHQIKPGQRVAILAANTPEWLLTFWASVSIGAVVVGINGWWAAPEMDWALEHCEPTVLFADSRGRERLRQTGVSHSFPVLDLGEEITDLVDTFAGASFPDIALNEDDPAVLLYTSGTSGRPKGAVHSHRNVIGMVQIQTRAQELKKLDGHHLPQDIACTSFPFFHVSGLYGSVVAAAVGGDTLVFVTGRFDSAKVLRAIETERCTRFSVVPTTAWRVVNDPTVGQYDLSSVTRIAGGAAPMTPELQQRLRAVFPNAMLGFGYGSTECTAMATGAPDADLLVDPRTAGRVMPTIELQVRDLAGNVVPDGVEGDVFVRSALVMLGYWRDPTSTSEAIGPNRWLRTGDIGTFADGKLSLTSRRSDLILRGGENVYPVEIEQCLDGHPAVAECAVIGLSDPEYGQEVCAIVVLNQQLSADAVELSAFVSTRLANYKVPTQWHLLTQALPRTATGKLMKGQLQEQFAGN